MTKYSINKKLNKVLNNIENQLLNIGENPQESINEIKRYMNEFKYLCVQDYNIAQYGNVLIYFHDIRELYKDYKSLEKVSDDNLWSIYKRQVGFVARYIISHEQQFTFNIQKYNKGVMFGETITISEFINMFPNSILLLNTYKNTFIESAYNLSHKTNFDFYLNNTITKIKASTNTNYDFEIIL